MAPEASPKRSLKRCRSSSAGSSSRSRLGFSSSSEKELERFSSPGWMPQQFVEIGIPIAAGLGWPGRSSDKVLANQSVEPAANLLAFDAESAAEGGARREAIPCPA